MSRNGNRARAANQPTAILVGCKLGAKRHLVRMDDFFRRRWQRDLSAPGPAAGISIRAPSSSSATVSSCTREWLPQSDL